MRKAKAKDREEDVLGLAGWMYADLFLALMVIFLATISFVPALIHNPVLTPQATKASANNADHFKALSLTYDSLDISLIESDVYDFQLKEGLLQGSPVIYGQFLGGYYPNESPDKGAFRALVFSSKLQSAKSGIFKKMAVNLDSTNKLRGDQVAMIFTFGPEPRN